MANLPAVLSKSIEAMQSITKTIDTSSGDFMYLKLSKAGEWLFGAEDEDIAENSLFVVGVETFVAGFQAWDEGELLGEEIRLITDQPLTRGDLEDVGAEWKPLVGFQLICIEGDNEGLQLVYKTTSKGGIKAVNTLMKEIVSRVNTPNNEGKLIPVVALTTDSYRHKKYGKIYTPMFEVVDWVDDAPVDTVHPEPAGTKAPDPDPDPTPTIEQPTPRRRRRA